MHGGTLAFFGRVLCYILCIICKVVEDSQGRDGGSKNATHSCLERDALKLITVLLILQLILLICWTAIDPLRWERNYINDDPTNTYGSCSGGTISTVFLVFIIALDFSALALACERAYRSRNIDDQFSESRYVVSSTLVQILNIFGTMAQPVSVSSLISFWRAYPGSSSLCWVSR